MIKILQEQGFLILEDAISIGSIAKLSLDLSKLNTSVAIRNSEQRVYGVRNLINISPFVKEFSLSEEVRRIVENLLGSEAKVVRAIYFNKTPEANWKVPWHQDLTISVKGKIATKGFSAWSLKAGVNHVQPPIDILERMLTLRFHLDDADETNGALKVLPKTQTFGRLSATEIQKLKSKNADYLCKVRNGDCLVMKPLLLHASSSGLTPKHRRVIHFEFSTDKLPNGLDWYGS